jgi:hypothetical protein
MATVCSECPAGKAGTVTNATSEESGCTIHCAPGYYSTSSSTICSVCPVNTYAYTFLTGPSCPSCPSFSSSAIRSMNRTNCTCDAGYSGPDGGACTACNPGQFKSLSGSGSCEDCNAGVRLIWSGEDDYGHINVRENMWIG